jgi:uncharacterized protein YbcI
MKKSIKEIECALNKVMEKFLREQVGEQAKEVTTQIVDDVILIKFKETLPPAERELATGPEGIRLIKQLKEKLLEKAKPLLEIIIAEMTGAKVVHMYSNIDLQTGQRIQIVTLDRELKNRHP